MTYYATLTFDLDKGVTTSQREKFYGELKKQNFAPHKLTTLWTASFRSGVTKEQAKSFTRKVVDDAAAFAGIRCSG